MFGLIMRYHLSFERKEGDFVPFLNVTEMPSDKTILVPVNIFVPPFGDSDVENQLKSALPLSPSEVIIIVNVLGKRFVKAPCGTILPVDEPAVDPPANIVCPETLESHLCEVPDGINSSGNPNDGSAC